MSYLFKPVQIYDEKNVNIVQLTKKETRFKPDSLTVRWYGKL